MSKKCKRIKDDGDRCGAWAQTDSEYCIAHDPERAAERQAWRKAGGEARATPEGEPVRVETIGEVLEQAWANLGSTWKQANTGERTRGINSTLGLILKAFEVGELAERVEAIEQRLEELKNADGQPSAG